MHADHDQRERFAAAEMARQDLYFFARWMFLQRRGFTWRRAAHHRVICDALMRIFRGECKRLIINIPPRYSKTELAVAMFIAWAMGKVPDAEFIHTSYSATLAANNSANVRDLVQHEAYREIFPAVELADQAKSHWSTTAGGVMYAAGAGGTITGFGAGKMREGFGGCFPAGTRVWTEAGAIPIDRIVRERMALHVWSYDYAGRMVLRPVVGWHENPPNAIVRVTFDDGERVECTPDHRFWTDGRGWVRADSLREDDRLPCVRGSVQGLDDIGVDAERAGGWLDAAAVLPADSVGPVGQGQGGLRSCQGRAGIGACATFGGNVPPPGDGCPGVAAPYLIDHGDGDAVSGGQRLSGNPGGAIDSHRLRVGEQCTRVSLGLAERPVRLAVGDVGGAAVVSEIGDPVVLGAAVGMADVCARRSSTYKGKHDERVNPGVLNARPARQADPQMPARFDRWEEHFPGLHVGSSAAGIGDLPGLAANPPGIADRVEPFISGHRKPSLIEFVRHDESTFCLTVEEHHNFTVECGLVVKNCIIIDDPHKADEARSDVIRQGVIDWFVTTLESRKNDPDGTPIILIMQRLHEKDLAGWLLDGGNGETWEHVCLSAWQDDGTPLWPEKHDAEALARMEKAAPYMFAGQYRQRPAPPEGGIFKPGMIETIDALPAGPIDWVRAWDLGASVGGDFTAGPKLGKLRDGRYVIGGMEREQYTSDKRDTLIKNTAARDGRTVRISLPQDPGQAGKSQVLAMTRMLAGYAVHSSPESGDKITRAELFGSQVNVGNVLMLRGKWNDALIEEMRMFPNGSYDDQIDGLSRAFEALMSGAGAYSSVATPSL